MGTTARKAVRPRKKTAAAAAAAVTPPENPWDGALDPGDQIEFSITAEVKNRQGRSFWVKGGASIRVRPDEGVENAKARVQSFVINMVDEQVSEYIK